MHARTSEKEREARILELESEITKLQKELGSEEDSQQIVARHIKLLRRNNEDKDAAQIILGKMRDLYAQCAEPSNEPYKVAGHKQTTICQIHEDYGLKGDD